MMHLLLPWFSGRLSFAPDSRSHLYSSYIDVGPQASSLFPTRSRHSTPGRVQSTSGTPAFIVVVRACRGGGVAPVEAICYWLHALAVACTLCHCGRLTLSGTRHMPVCPCETLQAHVPPSVAHASLCSPHHPPYPFPSLTSSFSQQQARACKPSSE